MADLRDLLRAYRPRADDRGPAQCVAPFSPGRTCQGGPEAHQEGQPPQDRPSVGNDGQVSRTGPFDRKPDPRSRYDARVSVRKMGSVLSSPWVNLQGP